MYNYILNRLLTTNKYILVTAGWLWISLFQAYSQDIRFAMLTDLHVSPQSENEKALYAVVEDINAKPYDLVVVTGDLTNTGSNPELLAVKAAMDKLNKPLLIIPGNHETNWSESAGLLFNELWGNDRFVHHKNGFLLVGFNTGPFMKMGDGHVKQEDIQWLKRTLQANKEEKIIAFSHYPIADGLDNWTDVSKILNDHHCIIDFCGHGHRLTLLNFNNMPGIMGRALQDKKGFGYNAVDIHDSRISVSEVLMNNSPEPITINLDTDSPAQISALPVSPAPDYSVNGNYNVRTGFELNDTVSIFAGPCLSGDSLIICGNSAGWIKAVRIKDKTVVWQRQYSGAIYSTPVIASGKVVFGTAGGYIKGLDIRDGKETWSVDAGAPVLSEAYAENKHVYIGGDKVFYKIHAITGEVLWSYNGTGGTIQGKPAVAGKNIVFGAWDTHLYCLDKNSGKLRWKWNNGKSQKLFSPGNIVPAIADDKVFIVAPDRYFTALDLRTGKEIWRTNRYKVRESMGISPDGKEVYAKLMNDSIIAVSALSRTFELSWAVNAGTGYDHNPCPLESNGKLVTGASKNGLVVAINPEEKAIRWKYKTGNASVNKLIYQKDGSLWLTTTDGKIISLLYKP